MNKEHPILFSSSMVRAILEGKKTQTRRVVKFSKKERWAEELKSAYQDGQGDWIFWNTDAPDLAEFTKRAYPNGGGYSCPYGKPGSALWVRETWQAQNLSGQWWHEVPKADRELCNWAVIDKADCEEGMPTPPKWIPGIFMPRWISRITLEVTGVRVERIQDISLSDCKAEGVDGYTFARGCISDNPPDPRWKFIEVWDSINAKRPGCAWKDNPWVFVIEFRQLTEVLQ